MDTINSRNKLHIFDHDPSVHEMYQLSQYGKEITILRGYKETADAILDMQPEIYTTQMSFLQHFFIEFGYDIILYLENGFTVEFTEEDLDEFYGYDQYYMLALYNAGELYEFE